VPGAASDGEGRGRHHSPAPARVRPAPLTTPARSSRARAARPSAWHVPPSGVAALAIRLPRSEYSPAPRPALGSPRAEGGPLRTTSRAGRGASGTGRLHLACRNGGAETWQARAQMEPPTPAVMTVRWISGIASRRPHRDSRSSPTRTPRGPDRPAGPAACARPTPRSPRTVFRDTTSPLRRPAMDRDRPRARRCADGPRPVRSDAAAARRRASAR